MTFKSTVFKSSVNTDHVEALKKLMRETVGRLYMDHYVCTDSDNVDAAIVLEELKNPACHTTACIAGFTTLLHQRLYGYKFKQVLDYETTALNYLGLKESLAPKKNPFDPVYRNQPSPWLFFDRIWPSDLQRRYNAALKACKPAKAVEVACEAIDRYIAEYQQAELAAWSSPIAIDEDAVERANLSTQP